MKIHNNAGKKRAIPGGKPLTSASHGGGKSAMAGQRDYAEQIWARWIAAEAGADKERPAAPTTGPPANLLNSLR